MLANAPLPCKQANRTPAGFPGQLGWARQQRPGGAGSIISAASRTSTGGPCSAAGRPTTRRQQLVRRGESSGCWSSSGGTVRARACLLAAFPSPVCEAVWRVGGGGGGGRAVLHIGCIITWRQLTEPILRNVPQTPSRTGRQKRRRNHRQVTLPSPRRASACLAFLLPCQRLLLLMAKFAFGLIRWSVCRDWGQIQSS